MKTKPLFSFGGGREMAGRNTVACFQLAQEIQDVHNLLRDGNFSDAEKAKLISDLPKRAKEIKLAVREPQWFVELFR